MSPGHRADAGGTLDGGVDDDLVLVVADLGLGDGADVGVGLVGGAGVVGGQDGGHGADDGAYAVVCFFGRC